MKNPEMKNPDAFNNLIKQLTEINRWLSVNGDLDYTRKKSLHSPSPCLFGFDPSASATKEDYDRYQAFFIPATATIRDFGISVKNNGYAYLLDAIKIVIDKIFSIKDFRKITIAANTITKRNMNIQGASLHVCSSPSLILQAMFLYRLHSSHFPFPS